MSDDIVTRLRDIASLRGNMSGNVIPVACNQAADEIERLRAELEESQMTVRALHKLIRERQ